MSRKQINAVTLGVMLSLFMAAVESTVVATAMPTIVGDLGGLAIYSWVFSAYMLTSTTTVPIYGKLSDIYGRRRLFVISMALFLTGSVLSGNSQNMTELIAFRALQGLGAGGILPLSFIIVGDMFSFEQRAKMQGLFSGVWGLASILGPLVGGIIVARLSWPWVFYVNIIPGLIATGLVLWGWHDRRPALVKAPRVDYLGTVFLSAGVVLLLMGTFEFGTPLGWGLLALSLVLLVALYFIERRAEDPVIPLKMFKDRLFASACGQGFLAGWTVFGVTSFVPLFVQAVLGTDATRAGATLTPQLLGWVAFSIIGGRLLLRVGYRTLALAGMILLTVGSFMLAQTNAESSQIMIMASLALMGSGMGLSVTPFLIAVQSTARKADLGTATATLQFSRSLGGAIGVSIMGAVLTFSLARNLRATGLDPATVSLGSLLNPLAQTVASVSEELRVALGGAIDTVFAVAFVFAVLGLIVTTMAPPGRIAQLIAQRAKADNPDAGALEPVGK